MFRIISILFFVTTYFTYGQIAVCDSVSKEPVSFATISFGNGNGTFADDEGKFLFTKKLYSDIDTLFISSLGYKEVVVLTNSIPDTLFLPPKVDKLQEVFISVKKDRKFVLEELKPYLDNDYYKCWLPTIESEIAVFFPNEEPNFEKQIATVHLPIALESVDWKKRKKANAEKKKFSTLFKVNLYENNNGTPGNSLLFENIVFRVTERDGDSYNLDITKRNIVMPQNGVFISIQVLGYTDKNGKLLPNKKYKEIKSRNGVVKIPTNFRPLLPFTDRIAEKRTYIKRVFINKNEWTLHSKNTIKRSTLIDAGLYNYGMGMSYKVFDNE